jgi:hypothetical protein
MIFITPSSVICGREQNQDSAPDEELSGYGVAFALPLLLPLSPFVRHESSLYHDPQSR